MNKNLEKAVQVVRNGGIVIFPTDTAFGIGCRIDDEKAVARLFKIRKRSVDKAVPVLASSIGMVEEYVEIPDKVRTLTEKYWPGALTIVLNCKKEKVSGLVLGGGEALGIRVPDHDEIRTLIKEVGVPILAPSANFAGENTPFKISDIDPLLASLVDGVFPGKCKLNKASTVLDCAKLPWKIIREGAVRINF